MWTLLPTSYSSTFLTAALVLYFDGSYRPAPKRIITTTSTKATTFTLPADKKKQKKQNSNNSISTKEESSSSSTSTISILSPYPNYNEPIVSCSAALMFNNNETTTPNENYEMTAATNICFVGGRCFSPIQQVSLLEEYENNDNNIGLSSHSSSMTSAHAEYEGLILGLRKLLSLLNNNSNSNQSSSNSTTTKITNNLTIRGDCKTIIQQLTNRSNPRKLQRSYNVVQELLKELKNKHGVYATKIELLPREDNRLTDCICRISIHTIQTYILNYIHRIIDVVDTTEVDTATSRNSNMEYLNHVWNVLSNKKITSFISQINRLKILHTLSVLCMTLDHFLLLEYIGRAFCTESSSSNTISIPINSIYPISNETNNTATSTKYDPRKWNDYVFAKGIQMQLYALEKLLSQSSTNANKKRMKELIQLQRKYKYRITDNEQSDILDTFLSIHDNDNDIKQKSYLCNNYLTDDNNLNTLIRDWEVMSLKYKHTTKPTPYNSDTILDNHPLLDDTAIWHPNNYKCTSSFSSLHNNNN